MRRVLLGDVMAAAQYVAAMPDCAQASAAAALIARTDAAHRYAKRFGRAHPIWGFGNLQALALLEKPVGAPSFDLGDARILQAIGVVSAALLARKGAAGLPCPKCAPCAMLRAARGHM
jgi:hypothetical protein